MEKSLKSRKIKKAHTLKDTHNLNQYQDKTRQFQTYFNTISKLIAPLRKINSLTDSQKYQKLLTKKRQELQNPFLPKSPYKTLFIDIDQTLVHSSIRNLNQSQKQNQKHQQVFSFPIEYINYQGDQKIICSVRPHAHEFLRQMAKYYTIYLYTASDQHYANKILQVLNQLSSNAISGFYSRGYCLEVSSNLFVKDPRVFSNISEIQYLIIDNHIASFYPTLQLGIPVTSYFGGQDDFELKNLSEFMIFLNGREDYINMIQQRFFLKSINQLIQKREDGEKKSTMSKSSSISSLKSEKSLKSAKSQNYERQYSQVTEKQIQDMKKSTETTGGVMIVEEMLNQLIQ